MSIEAMVDQMRTDILDGWGDSGAKCGAIGEVGCSWPLTRTESLDRYMGSPRADN